MVLARELYAHWKSGNTPQGRGIQCESALYRRTMAELASLETEARNWFDEVTKPKPDK